MGEQNAPRSLKIGIAEEEKEEGEEEREERDEEVEDG